MGFIPANETSVVVGGQRWRNLCCGVWASSWWVIYVIKNLRALFQNNECPFKSWSISPLGHSDPVVWVWRMWSACLPRQLSLRASWVEEVVNWDRPVRWLLLSVGGSAGTAWSVRLIRTRLGTSHTQWQVLLSPLVIAFQHYSGDFGDLTAHLVRFFIYWTISPEGKDA